jgi:RND family efflux transporter MFP subunit
VKRLKKSTCLAFLMMVISCATTVFLIAREEEAHVSKIRKQVLSVETVPVQKTDYRVRVPAWGFVEPREIVDIRPQISGKITHVPASVFTGAAIKQGASLFLIDERDYQNALTEATAAAEQARQALEIEKGQQTIAKTEWKLLENSKWQGHQNKALALREPQLKEREAAVQMAAARQSRAALDVDRARITAPCDGEILAEHVAKGQVIDTDDVVVRMACTDCYHITAWFSPEYSIDAESHPVVIDIGMNTYDGMVKAVLPRINLKTRQKQALVEFAGQGVFLGAYASLTLPGPYFKNVVVLPKEALRSGSTVWLLSQSSTLKIRKVVLLAQDKLNIVIAQGLTEGDHVILSHIASPLQGMDLCRAIPIAEGPQNSVENEEHGE